MADITPLDLQEADAQAALASWLAAEADANDVTISDVEPLGGGAIHLHWRLDATFDGGASSGEHELVVRAAGDATLAESLDLVREFAVARAAADAGATVPEPLWCCEDASVLGRPFAVSRFAPGVAAAHLLVRNEALGGSRPVLLARIGEELARLQTVPLDTPSTGIPAEARAEPRAGLRGGLPRRSRRSPTAAPGARVGGCAGWSAPRAPPSNSCSCTATTATATSWRTTTV